VNGSALVDAVTAIWQSRRTTVVCVLLFALAVARGVWLGRAERRDVDTQVRVCIRCQDTTTREVSWTGRANFASVLDSGRQAVLIGPWQLDVHCRDLAAAVLRLTLSWEESWESATWRVVDTATGTERVLDQPIAHRRVLTIPLPTADTTLRFLPSLASLGVRVHAVELQPATTLPPFTVEDCWHEVHRDAAGRSAIGAGFLPLQAGEHGLRTRRCAWLRIDPAAPGPHRLRLAVQRADPGAALPIVTLGGRRIWSASEGTTVWSRAATLDGVTTIELDVDLAATNVVGLECAGPLRSERERGVGDDPSRVAYLVSVARCEPLPPK